jgi:hypothetical protein
VGSQKSPAGRPAITEFCRTPAHRSPEPSSSMGMRRRSSASVMKCRSGRRAQPVPLMPGLQGEADSNISTGSSAVRRTNGTHRSTKARHRSRSRRRPKRCDLRSELTGTLIRVAPKLVYVGPQILHHSMTSPDMARLVRMTAPCGPAGVARGRANVTRLESMGLAGGSCPYCYGTAVGIFRPGSRSRLPGRFT